MNTYQFGEPTLFTDIYERKIHVGDMLVVSGSTYNPLHEELVTSYSAKLINRNTPSEKCLIINELYDSYKISKGNKDREELFNAHYFSRATNKLSSTLSKLHYNVILMEDAQGIQHFVKLSIPYQKPPLSYWQKTYPDMCNFEYLVYEKGEFRNIALNNNNVEIGFLDLRREELSKYNNNVVIPISDTNNFNLIRLR